MKKLNELKVSKKGKIYLEIDPDVLLSLGWSIGDLILIELLDYFMDDKVQEECLLKNTSKIRKDYALGNFGLYELKNDAPNREPLPDT